MQNSESINKHTAEDQDSDVFSETEESFELLLEKDGSLPVMLSPGEKVTSRVVSISSDFVYIDLPGKTEGVIDISEFTDDNGDIRVQTDDEVEVFFLGVRDGIRRFTTFVHGYPAAKLYAVRDAHSAGLPVDGDVRREIKGGFEISVGGVRCFCPFSQIDIKGGRDSSQYVGKTLPFMVIEFVEDGRNIILSRRVLLEQEKQARIERLQNTLQEGMVVTARIISLQKFGAFVDLGGIDGLIPLSEISWSRTDSINDVMSPGAEVTVRIISLDWDKLRITLSRKAMQPDPWLSVADRYKTGDRVGGKIVRLAPFGAFVNLEEGVDGLIHISNLGAGRRINHPKEVATVGQTAEVYILDVNVQDRRISLSLQPKVEPKKIVLPEIGELFEGVVEKVMPYGLFVTMNEGLKGLIPNAEMGTPMGADHKQMFPAGTAINVAVIDVDESSAKIRLSRRAVLEKEARAEYDKYLNAANHMEENSGGLGSLGEILKAKIEERKQTD